MKIPKLEKSSYFILAFLFLYFFVSFMVWIVKFPGIRRTFVFQASDSGKQRLETRYEPVNPPQGKYHYYIDELLLGPISEHCQGIFQKGTRVLGCSKKDDTLYVNLSKEILQANAFNADFKAQAELFKKNILMNFSNIKNVKIFIEGTTPFGD